MPSEAGTGGIAGLQPDQDDTSGSVAYKSTDSTPISPDHAIQVTADEMISPPVESEALSRSGSVAEDQNEHAPLSTPNASTDQVSATNTFDAATVEITHAEGSVGDDTGDFSGVDLDRDRKAARRQGRGTHRWLRWIVKKDDAEHRQQVSSEERRAQKLAEREESRANKEAEKEAARAARMERKDQEFEARQLAKLERVRARAEASRKKDDEKRADRDEREAAKSRAEEIRRASKTRQEQDDRARKEERQRNKADRRADDLVIDDNAIIAEEGAEVVDANRGLISSIRERGEYRRRLRRELLDARRDKGARNGEDSGVLTTEEKKLLRVQLKEERRRIKDTRKIREENERADRRDRREAEKADRRATEYAEKSAKGEREKLVRSFKNTRSEEKARKKEAARNAKAEADRIKELRKAEIAQRRADERAAKKMQRQEQKYRSEVRKQQKKKANQQRSLLREETKIARRARRIEMPEIAITRDEQSLGPAYQWDAEVGMYNSTAAGGEVDSVAFDLPEPLPRR